MSTVQNKRIVEAFCGHFAHARISEVLAMMHEDATWWVNGKPHLFAGAGIKTRAEMAGIWQGLYAVLDGGLEMRILSMIAENDCVAAEVRSYATTKRGAVYENDYHLLFRLADGKILQVKEYTDLMHAKEVFG